MESTNKRFIDYSIKQVPVEIDQAVEEYRTEKYRQTGSKLTKNTILKDALEIGFKEMGILQ